MSSVAVLHVLREKLFLKDFHLSKLSLENDFFPSPQVPRRFLVFSTGRMLGKTIANEGTEHLKKRFFDWYGSYTNPNARKKRSFLSEETEGECSWGNVKAARPLSSSLV